MQPKSVFHIRNQMLARYASPAGLPEEVFALVSGEQCLSPADFDGRPFLDITPSGDFRLTLGSDQAMAAAMQLKDWNDHMLRQAACYHISGPLATYAWARERHDGPRTIDRDTLTSPAGNPYGFLMFGRPLEFSNGSGVQFPIRALAWGPVADISWRTRIALTDADGTPYLVSGPTDDLWHFRAFCDKNSFNTNPITAEIRAAGRPLVEEFDFIFRAGMALSHESGSGMLSFHRFARILVISMGIARSPWAEKTALRPERGLRRAAARHGIADPNEPVTVLSLRPQLHQAAADALYTTDIDGADTLTEGKFPSGPRRYRLPTWWVSPSIDPETGKVRKKGYEATRNPNLLTGMGPEPVVYRGNMPKGQTSPERQD